MQVCKGLLERDRTGCSSETMPAHSEPTAYIMNRMDCWKPVAVNLCNCLPSYKSAFAYGWWNGVTISSISISIASLHAVVKMEAPTVSQFAFVALGKNLREEMRIPYSIKVVRISRCGDERTLGKFLTSKGASLEARDIARMMYAQPNYHRRHVVEDMVIRPVLGDL